LNTEIISQEYNSQLKETKFQEHKLHTSDLVLKLFDTGFNRQADKTAVCGDFLEFTLKEHLQTKEQKQKLHGANFCKFRFCPYCNWRRTRNITGQLKEALQQIKEEREVSYLFLTLTVKNPKMEDLRQTIRDMNTSFLRLARMKEYKKAVLGHFKSIEILGTKTKKGFAHPHFHILLIVNKSYFQSRDYIKQQEWKDMWKKALKVDYDPQVDVRRIKSKNKDWNEIDSAVTETVKYSVKHTSLTKLNDEDFTILLLQTAKMRFFSTAGILKDKMNLIKADEDLINLTAEQEQLWIEICKMLYKFQDGAYYLKKLTYDKEAV